MLRCPAALVQHSKAQYNENNNHQDAPLWKQ